MKSECRSIQHDLSDYIDCTLSGRRTVVVAQHLRTCTVCQAELAALRKTKGLLRFYVPSKAPVGYQDRFWYKLRDRIETRPKPMWHGMGPLPHVLVWRIRQRFTEIVAAWQKQLGAATNWMQMSPVYATLAFAILVSLLVSGIHQSQHPRATEFYSFRRALSEVYPVWPVKLHENRGLISSRERLIRTTSALHGQVSYENPRFEQQASISRPLAETVSWENQLSNVNNDHETLNKVVKHYAVPDLAFVAQLSNPSAIASQEYNFQPLGEVMRPMAVTISRGNNQNRDRFAHILMNVAIQNLSFPEVQEAVKL